MCHEGVKFLERMWIDQQLDPFTSRQFTLLVLGFDPFVAATFSGLGAHCF